jgi:hypothetical protein
MLAIPSPPLGALSSPAASSVCSSSSRGVARWEDTASALISTYGGIATCILPWLYVSGGQPACSASLLRELNVGLVVNAAGEAVANAFEGSAEVSYLTLALRDGPGEDVWCLFASVCRAIECARAAGKASLLCCHMGISRSASFAISYLMWAAGIPQRLAYLYVRSMRPVVSPNPGFTCQLLEWQAHLALLGGAGCAGEAPPPLLFHLRKLFGGCSFSGPLFAAHQQPFTHALTLFRCPETRSLIAPSAAEIAVALRGLRAGEEALLSTTFSQRPNSVAACTLHLAAAEAVDSGDAAPDAPAPGHCAAAPLAAAAQREVEGWRYLFSSHPASLRETTLRALIDACAAHDAGASEEAESASLGEEGVQAALEEARQGAKAVLEACTDLLQAPCQWEGIAGWGIE